jgi:uncharacterized protein YkwD
MITLLSTIAYQTQEIFSRLRAWLPARYAAMQCTRRSDVCRAGLVFATCAALAACGGSGSATATEPPGELTAVLDRMDAPRLVPSRPAAAVYASEPAARRQITALDEPLRVQIFQAVRDSAAQRGITVLPDERLDAVMDQLAKTLRPNEQSRSTAVEFLLSYHGVIEPYPVIHGVHARAADDREIVQLLLESIAWPTDDDLVTLGIGIDRATSENRILVAVQTKLLDLAPVQRVWPNGAEIDVSGRLLGVFREPHFYVTFPSGEAQRYPILVRQQEFLTRIRCDRGPGIYQLEVFGNNGLGPKVLANFPVYCGVDPPAAYEGAAGYVPPRVAPNEAETQLLDLVNQARRHAGLAEVPADPRLADVARAHSRDMHENNFVGHISPTTGGPMDRVLTAGLSFARVLENVGRDASAEEVHAGLMRSPGHRSAILDAGVTHVGIGVVVVAPEDGPVGLIATELFR